MEPGIGPCCSTVGRSMSWVPWQKSKGPWIRATAWTKHGHCLELKKRSWLWAWKEDSKLVQRGMFVTNFSLHDKVENWSSNDTTSWTDEGAEHFGHFTQIAWADTQYIGCGIISYKDLEQPKYPYRKVSVIFPTSSLKKILQKNPQLYTSSVWNMAVLMALLAFYVCQCHHFIKANDRFNYLIIGEGRLLDRLMCHIWLLADFNMQLLTTRKLSRATSLCFWHYPRIRLFKWSWRRTMSLKKCGKERCT